MQCTSIDCKFKVALAFFFFNPTHPRLVYDTARTWYNAKSRRKHAAFTGHFDFFLFVSSSKKKRLPGWRWSLTL